MRAECATTARWGGQSVRREVVAERIRGSRHQCLLRPSYQLAAAGRAGDACAVDARVLLVQGLDSCSGYAGQSADQAQRQRVV